MHVKQIQIKFLSTSSYAIQQSLEFGKKQGSPASLASNLNLVLEFKLLLQTITAFKSNSNLIKNTSFCTHKTTQVQSRSRSRFLAWQTMVSNFQLYVMKVDQRSTPIYTTARLYLVSWKQNLCTTMRNNNPFSHSDRWQG